MNDMTDTEPAHGISRAPRGRFSAGLVGPCAGERRAALRRQWDIQAGRSVPLPAAGLTSSGDSRASIRGLRIHDVLITKICYASTTPDGKWIDSRYFTDMLVVDVVENGSWGFARSRDRDQVVVSTGQFIVRHNNPSWRFAVKAHTNTTRKLVLPVAHLGPLIHRRPVLGSADSAEMRLLLAHARMVDDRLDELSPAGVRAARNALLELALGVLTQKVDGTEPQLAPALVLAAKDLIRGHLSDPELSPRMLARELNISVRTLHRAFASTDESVTAHIRHQRLEQARLALTGPTARPGVSEVARFWQFADTSHFVRAFKKQYGQTPAQYARSHDGPRE
ncbi:helix-turn-helix domain-containing protein [Streptomyces sp. W16]|uniref:helix-turn-helix domain-containing protein n=1 Tax=Streptomyces sp. W16 TaxID=3076631 RepID=UPI00295AA2AA|nr:helix-turn-helix domain-containing protein [Streptomyces sp. W16]MDV9169278.1 helix-turn-helix domain-containing protein [Streptomyces sp. W16]